jgi:hypothetical protein
MSLNEYDIKREAVLSKIFSISDREKQLIFMHICLAVEEKKHTVTNPSILLPVFHCTIKDSLQWTLPGNRSVEILIGNPIGIEVVYQTHNTYKFFTITKTKMCPELGDEIQKHCIEILIPFITNGENQLCQ